MEVEIKIEAELDKFRNSKEGRAIFDEQGIKWRWR